MSIRDEFSDLPISRQRKYQLRMRRAGRCVKCGAPTQGTALCLRHLIQVREYSRKKFGLKRRNLGSFSYQVEMTASQAVSAGGPPAPVASPFRALVAWKGCSPAALDALVPAHHALRKIKSRVENALRKLEPCLRKLDARSHGPASMSPRQLLGCCVLMTVHGVPSCATFAEQLPYNLLWLWFLDRNPMEPAIDPAVFAREYHLLLRTPTAKTFFELVLGGQASPSLITARAAQVSPALLRRTRVEKKEAA